MKNVKVILVRALLVLFVGTAWQIAAWELSYIELQDDLKDMASLTASRIRLAGPSSDDDFRKAVVGKAKDHGITLDPRQVTVERSGTEESPGIYLEALPSTRYLPWYSFVLHFKPTSKNKGF